MNSDQREEEAEVEQAVLRQLGQQPLYMLETEASLPYTQQQVAGAFERLSAWGTIVVQRLHGRFHLRASVSAPSATV